jgi:hypothetical protein
LVSWSGADNTGGSGIGKYDIYVSDNGGTFAPWLTGTTQTSATYNGQAQHSYAFYSVATDNAGNVESKTAHAEAQTYVDSAPILSVGTDASLNEGSTFTRTLSFTDPDVNDSWTATVNYGDGSGAQSVAVHADKTIQINHLYSDKGAYRVTVAVTDSHQASDSEGFTANVANVPPAVNAGPSATAAVGVAFTGTGSFSDPGINDTFTAMVNYGDGSGYKPLALNANQTFVLNNTYAKVGTYTVTVQVTDNNGCVGMATRQVTVSAPNVAVNTQINDGSAQRSAVTSITYTFTSAIDHFDAGAFTLTLAGGASANVTIAVANPSNDHKTFILTFSGAGTNCGSLADGRYTLTLHASMVHAASGLTLSGGDSILNFFRLFGDVDGDGYVSTADLACFRKALNKKSTDVGYLAYIDFDGDGVITAADYAQFNLRLGKRI